MDARDTTILHLVRLGLAGDVSSLQRYARTLLRRPGPEGENAPDEFRRQLSRLLSDQTSARSALRSAAPARVRDEDRALSRQEDLQIAEAPILAPDCRVLLDRVLKERREKDRLAEGGLEPTRSALFVGPPGVGKTMAARHLAAELQVPLVTLDLVSVMSSLLGKSGQNIREALELARSSECVFLLDEVDSIAKRRDDAADVGELKRIVNLLLLELDRWPTTSLLVAATNHPELLDRAVWRRFDLVVEFALPDSATRAAILDALTRAHGGALDDGDRELLAEATEGASGSELARMVRASARAALLARTNGLRTPLLEEAIGWLLRRARDDAAGRALYCRLAHQGLGMSHRQISETLGVSHVTVGNLLRAVGASRRGRAKALLDAPADEEP
jgi:SpoVK/Ycf46/Vps4 family AAA+-type ATPase